MSAPIDLGLLNGKAKTLAKAEYPETAKKAAIGGAVKINVTVDEQGNVTKAEAVSGELLLRDAALAAARATKFEPYLVKGNAVKFSGNLVFNFVAPVPDVFASKESIQKEIENLSTTLKTVDDPKMNRDLLKDKTNSTKAKDSTKDDDDDDDSFTEEEMKALNSLAAKKYKSVDDERCRTASFTASTPPLFKDEKLVDVQTINAIINNCDAAIKADSSTPSRNFYRRSLARYYLIRGYDAPLGKTLSTVATVSADDLRLALSDLEIYLGWTDPENKSTAYDLRKMGNIMAGELIAVTAYKDRNSAFLLIALKKLAAAQDYRKDNMLDSGIGAGENDTLNGVIAQDRALIEGVLKKNGVKF
ncbi:MAG TPA: TonB family protein [Pyrinomonadaceae bacterium]|nr:TonB family protein [Pyrinomonadaceae bacterium]